MRGRSVDRDELIAIALRYDTSMSHAMLRASGVPIPKRHVKPKKRRHRYRDIRECFKNRRRVRL